MNARNMSAPLFLLLVFALAPLPRVAAQSGVSSAGLASVSFDTSDFPQWAKDARRLEIVAFGSFPFTMFTATFIMDTWRWTEQNGMNWSDEGRRYAPWPLKAAGAVDMTGSQHAQTIAAAAGLSLAIAVTDYIIVRMKRQKEQRRIDSLPPGTAIIVRRPPEDLSAGNADDDGGDTASGGDTADGGGGQPPPAGGDSKDAAAP